MAPAFDVSCAWVVAAAVIRTAQTKPRKMLHALMTSSDTRSEGTMPGDTISICCNACTKHLKYRRARVVPGWMRARTTQLSVGIPSRSVTAYLP